ncbi:Smr/MutS family protein [Reichenbachiella carrageenanivorans]|uniref:Endonuclease MutS2 n=1 Tax=Reichenbachiella carrageenanivorans TaxID=2979869 RepID=A0ABY6CYP3_9BACT|nr:Smr/MutS family protein [Reichenbachiella carrageenanivorans]UXX79047.1 Smr/MutS family protein [Reichenbachiella carrageenanivorans]
MNFYPKDIEVKLGFDKIKQLIKDRCLSTLGEDYVDRLTLTTHTSKINEWMDQTREFIKILSSGSSFPQSNYTDVSPSLKRAELPGNFLDEDEFFDVKLVLGTLLKMLRFFEHHQEDYPVLSERVSHIDLGDSLYIELEKKIDEKGQLRDDASRELMSIRSAISKSQIRARTAVNKILKEASKHGYCPETPALTIREGRMVIPVLAEHKRHVKGFVHDESATGQTVYMEPAEALEINNEIRELQYAERREIVRILTVLTDELRGHLPEVRKGIKILGVIDFIRAKAKFGIDFDCTCPELSKSQKINWQRARHPILEAALNEQGKKIVPLHISLSREKRIMLISGPNAGGKSVCIKTIGLLQYMVQCGLPVSASESSEFGTFQAIFIDIGDEQSIENDLSTYSSHLTNMKYFLENATRNTLFLIDEFGTGTEPQFGGAIAEVVLLELNKAQSFGAITTHYGNLKKVADKENGIVNAAMKFDVKQLEPMYELEIGKPGSSFALEIAGKIGLNPEMLNRAKKKAGISHVQFDRLLSELESEKNQIAKDKKAIEAKNARLSDAIKDYEDLKKYLEKEKTKVIKQAQDEAARVIQSSNKKIEATIKAIKESKADQKRTLEAREALKAHAEKVVKKEAVKEKPKVVDVSPIQVGDKVQLKSGAVGEVDSIKGKHAELLLGGLKSRVKLNDLVKISSKEFKKTTDQRVQTMTGINLNDKMASFSATLDIRGVRAEEAIGKVEYYIDEALLLGYVEVKILHGKGHGVLRELVRNVLRENPKVLSAKDEHIEHGGAGITVVTLGD